jgi:hypothetical protein
MTPLRHGLLRATTRVRTKLQVADAPRALRGVLTQDHHQDGLKNLELGVARPAYVACRTPVTLNNIVAHYGRFMLRPDRR